PPNPHQDPNPRSPRSPLPHPPETPWSISRTDTRQQRLPSHRQDRSENSCPSVRTAVVCAIPHLWNNKSEHMTLCSCSFPKGALLSALVDGLCEFVGVEGNRVPAGGG